MSGNRGKVVSLFSGAMGLDLGLERAGLEPAVCVENDPLCCMTIRHNRPHLPVIAEDIASVSTPAILAAAGLQSGEAFAVVGGPPCQPFSTGGLRRTIRDRRGNLFAEFLRVVAEAQPLYFVFENVAQIVTAAVNHRPIAQRPGQRWHLSSYQRQNGHLWDDGAAPLSADEQAGSALDLMLDVFDSLGYSLTFGILNAADFGVPQRRLRFVLLGSRIQAEVIWPTPTHSADPTRGLPAWRTLRDAIGNLKETNAQHSQYTPAFQRYFGLVPPGGNWRHLPPELQREALGDKAFVAGGGKTGFFRRLAWDEPAPTIVGKSNRKSSALCHPEAIRPLTVREAARVQGFPDDWQFVGNMHAQYLQIGNAVPVGLGLAIGRALLDSYHRYCQHSHPETELAHLHDWQERREQMVTAAQAILRTAARNKSHGKQLARADQPPSQLALFF